MELTTENENIEVFVDFSDEDKSHHIVLSIGYLDTEWDGWYAKLKIEEAEKLRDMLIEAIREYGNRVNPAQKFMFHWPEVSLKEEWVKKCDEGFLKEYSDIFEVDYES